MPPSAVRSCASKPLSFCIRHSPRSGSDPAAAAAPAVARGRGRRLGQRLQVRDERGQLVVRDLDRRHASRRHALGDDARQPVGLARVQSWEDRHGPIAAGGVGAVAQRAAGPVRFLAVRRGQAHRRQEDSGDWNRDSHGHRPMIPDRRLTTVQRRKPDVRTGGESVRSRCRAAGSGPAALPGRPARSRSLALVGRGPDRTTARSHLRPPLSPHVPRGPRARTVIDIDLPSAPRDPLSTVFRACLVARHSRHCPSCSVAEAHLSRAPSGSRFPDVVASRPARLTPSARGSPPGPRPPRR